jgi:PAS domain S-box-containing protein
MMIGKKLKEIPDIVGVDNDKCVNCHNCISACPVKYCNDGSGDYVTVNPFMCIGCGSCINRCSHGARFWVDDFDRFIEDCQGGQKIIAIVAPSVAANFPNSYMYLNGWLKSLGVTAVFDVSFGAELTVKSYMEYLNSKNKKTPVISQPCPAIVTYIEMYLPNLLPYLAPVDSPMLHTMKMIRKFYNEYDDFKIAVISPCLAKKREFFETKLGEYNIGFKSISNFLEKNKIDLKRYTPDQYVNPPAERAVGFSSPGGLLRTAERWSPGISEVSRKIEGEGVYSYLDNLEDAIKNQTAPLLIDCLNCGHGCNGGPLTITDKKSLDDIETAVMKRSHQVEALYNSSTQNSQQSISLNDLNEILSKFWEPGLYERHYSDMSINNRIVIPSEDELWKIFKSMRKNCDSDLYNCSSCGYGTCENMAIAIYNGLNRPDNCHFYLAEESKLKHAQISENEKRLRTILSTTSAGFCLADEEFKMIVVNPSFCKIIGMDKDKLIGSTFLKKQFERCSNGSSYSSEIRINRPDGGTGMFLFIANPYYDEHKTLVGYFAMVIDIGKYKKDTGSTNVQFTGDTSTATRNA